VLTRTRDNETATRGRRTPLKRLARTAGLLYIAIFVLYPAATIVRSSFVVSGDAATTAANIAANESLFRTALAGEATVFLIEIVLAAILYVLLRPVSRSMSLGASLARVAEGVVMAAGTLVMGVFALVAVSDAGYLSAFSPEQRDALIMFFQDANEYLVLIWGFFFALSLVLTGWLVYRSGFFPRIPGVLLILAGVGYFAQSFGTIVAPGAADMLTTLVFVLAIPGELVFATWLVTKGVDEEKWHESLEAPEEARL
jgi:Domain of unknown function (DUF4386)